MYLYVYGNYCIYDNNNGTYPIKTSHYNLEGSKVGFPGLGAGLGLGMIVIEY
jgi:hypothetical protein